MRVEVDADTCLGYGECAAVAPALFVLGDRHVAEVVTDGAELTEAQEALARVAEQRCPVGAIRVLDA